MVPFLVILALVAIVLYVGLMLREVPGFAEQRLGKLEERPADMDRWLVDEESAEAQVAQREGLTRETRTLLKEGGLTGDQWIHQARYRDGEGAIVRVEPERRVKRRRLKAT